MNDKIIFIATSSSIIEYENIFKKNKLYEKYFSVKYNSIKRKLNIHEIIENCYDCVGIVAGTEKYTENVIKELHKLKVISRLGVGMDNIDLEAARERNIKVYKTTTTPAPAVAELTLGLMLDVARKVSHQCRQLTAGIWKKEMGTLLQCKTLGIIGLGTIGKTLVKLVGGFNFKILAYDIYHDDIFEKKHDITYCDINTLLKESDIVSIHLNLSDQTMNLMNKQKLGMMKPDSILINASRGEIVDEKALYNALKNERILGAGLDVFRKEPYNGPLTKLNNVVLTPHIGSYAKEIRIQMEIEAAKNLLKGFQNAK